MSFIVTSKSSPTILLDSSSQKEVISTSDNSVVINNNNLLLGYYSTTIPYIEEDEMKLPALYHHYQNNKMNSIEGGSTVEEEDTEDEDDDEDLLPSSVAALGENQEPSSIILEEGKTPPAASVPVPIKVTSKSAAATGLIKKAPLYSSFSHSLLPPIQTYSPQLNLSLYSPSIASSTPISSIRIKKNRAYNTSSPAIAPCLLDTSTVQNPTSSLFIKQQQQKPLYSSTLASSPSTIASTIKMDIRSPPQPSQSISRFMNAFHRFRGSSSVSHNKHQHQNANNNSVAPAEIMTSSSTMKPSPSKSSLADKIKNKFQQQLNKKKRASLVGPSRKNSTSTSNKKKSSSSSTEKTSFSMPRSASLSSITNWSRLSKTSVVPAMPANRKSLISAVKQQHQKMIHSTSATSFRSSNSSLSTSSSSSRSSSGVATTSTATNAAAPPFSLTKSISSHRLYKNNNSTSTNIADTRPRQPLRAVNPNDSVRLSSSRQSSVQQQQKKKKTAVRFTKLVSVRETFSKAEYDRGSDPEAVCTRLTPAMAQHIKEELNAYKLHEMQVHEYSRVHTHFFL